jgi:hypothetical protein
LSDSESQRERERERKREFFGVMAAMGDSPRSGLSSPEAKVGMRVEDLWDVMEPQLSPTEKLNACFESIPVSAFPPAPSDKGINFQTHTHTHTHIYIYIYICKVWESSRLILISSQCFNFLRWFV